MALDFDTDYDSIVSRIGTLLSNHVRLTNPYALEENPDILLKQGWGLALGPGGTNTNRLVSKHRTTSVDFQLSITRRVYATDHSATSKANTDKLLLEDARVLIDDIHKNNFNISTLVSFLDFEGVFPVKADNYSYLALRLNFTLEYFIAT